MSKRKFILLVSIVLYGFIFGSLQNSFGQMTYDYKDTGGRLPTPEQEAKFRKTHSHVTGVQVNPIGLYRINRERARKHLPLLDYNKAVPFGQDIERVKDLGITTPQPSGSNQAPGGASPYPSNIDNVTDTITSPYFPPIGNQANHLDCQSWAIVYYQLTYMNAMAKGWTVSNNDTTKIFSPRSVYSMINSGVDVGAWEGQVYPVLEMNGAETLSEFSSNPADNNLAWDYSNPDHWKHALSARTNPVDIISACSTCNLPIGETATQVTSWINTTYTPDKITTWINTIKGLLNNAYILTFQNYIHEWVFTTVTGPSGSSLIGQQVAYAQNASAYDAGHVMTIVGYNDTIAFNINGVATTGAFKIANQWGGQYNNGFLWLAYDALYTTSQVSSSFPADKFDTNGYPSSGRTPAIWNNEVYEVTVKPNYSPKLLAEFTVNQTQRGQLQMFLGTSAIGANIPTTTDINVPAGQYPGALDQDGGALAFDGSSSCLPTTTAGPTACNQTPMTQSKCNSLAVDGCYWSPASPGFAAACYGSCSRVGAPTCSNSATIPAGCKYAPAISQCWGTPASCYGLNPSSCSAQAGCTLTNGVCGGSPTVCSTYASNPSVCNAHLGCEFNGSSTFVLDFTDFLPCTGTASVCGTFVSPSACASQAGCSWASGACTGTATACSTLGLTTCTSQAGCQAGASGTLNFYLGMADHTGVCVGYGYNYLGDILNTPSVCTADGGFWVTGSSSTLSSYQLIDLTTNTTTQATGLPVTANGNTVYSPIVYNFLGHIPPIAYATATPNSGPSPMTVSFDGSGSSAASGSNISSYTWNFGDGTTGSGAIVSHTYTSLGLNPAVLTVTDNLGATGSYVLPTAISVQPAITVGAVTNGSISPSGNVGVNLNGSQSFIITANPGYSIYQILVDNNPVLTESVYTVSYTYTFTNVTANHMITATFNPVINASAGTGLTISPSGNVPVISTASKTFTISPQSGYIATLLFVDGTLVGTAGSSPIAGGPPISAPSSYTFTNVQAPHTITWYSSSVSGFPIITTQPVSVTVTPGMVASFTIFTSPPFAPGFTYQWLKNGTAVSGATGPSYTTPPTTASSNGDKYMVIVSNLSGSVASNAAILTVH